MTEQNFVERILVGPGLSFMRGYVSMVGRRMVCSYFAIIAIIEKKMFDVKPLR